jgi:hypothetical protein
MIRALLLAGAVCVIATPALTQKGPSAAPGSEPDPVRGVTLDEFSETDSNMLTLGGITARIEAQANNDDTTTPVFVIQDASGEVLRFEGEPSFFSFLPASMRLANIDPSTPEPELIASSYTGGAHCCDRIQIAALSPDGTWQVHELGLFDGGYALGMPMKTGSVRSRRRSKLPLHLRLLCLLVPAAALFHRPEWRTVGCIQ